MTVIDAEKWTLERVVAANIRAVTALRGMNQSDLARELGVSRATVSIKWRAERPWSLSDIDAVARVLQIDHRRLTGELLATVEEVQQQTTEAPVRLDEGSDTVRHQGLEPRTRWFGALAPALDVVGTGAGFDGTPARWELAA